jgi:hypothetical protein
LGLGNVDLSTIYGDGSSPMAQLLASVGVTPGSAQPVASSQATTPSSAATKTTAASPANTSSTTTTLPYTTPALTPAQTAIANTPQMLWLTPTVLSNLQAAAAANTPQWMAFNNELTTGLPEISTYNGAYNGSELVQISSYALGYQVLKTSNPTLAASYADKAVGLMNSAVTDFQGATEMSRQFLAVTDGTTTTFTLPNSNYIPASFNVYTAPVTTQAVVRGTRPSDTVGFYLHFLSVSNTPGGPANYTQGIDYLHDPTLSNDQLEWTTTGAHPAPGATYYLTSASGQKATVVPRKTQYYSLNGNQLTFTTTPAAGQAIFVEYVYNTNPAAGLTYQQTGSQDGGFNSIMVGDAYGARYLEPNVATGLAWLDGYSGFTPALRTNVINTLISWDNYTTFTSNLWMHNSPESNYGAGDYYGNVITSLALCGRSPLAPQMISQVLAYRATYVLPALTGSAPSLNGGFWAEGWSYGTPAAESLILSGVALENAGLIPAATEERTWASQVVRALIEEQASPGTLYDAGDWYTTHPRFLNREFFEVLGVTASDPLARSYANYIVQNYANSSFVLNPKPTAMDMLYNNPNAPAAYWSNEPLEYYAVGGGLVTARSDWGATPNLVTFQCGNRLATGHQSDTPGQLEIFSGNVPLLANGATLTGTQIDSLKSSLSNTVVIDDGGAGYQRYRWANSTNYGPGVGITAYEAAGNYVYSAGNYAGTYDSPGYPGSVSQLNREVVYLRPGEVVVYDRATTTQPQFSKQLRWSFINAPTVNGNSFVETINSATLFGQTFSTAPIATNLVPTTVNGVTVQQLQTQNTNISANVNYLTAFQIGTTANSSMATTTHILSTNKAMEGTQIGNNVVMFGYSGQVAGANPATYTFTGMGPVQHTIVDLVPGQTYQVKVNGSLLTSVTASPSGVITFNTTTSNTTTVQII